MSVGLFLHLVGGTSTSGRNHAGAHTLSTGSTGTYFVHDATSGPQGQVRTIFELVRQARWLYRVGVAIGTTLQILRGIAAAVAAILGRTRRVLITAFAGMQRPGGTLATDTIPRRTQFVVRRTGLSNGGLSGAHVGKERRFAVVFKNARCSQGYGVGTTNTSTVVVHRGKGAKGAAHAIGGRDTLGTQGTGCPKVGGVIVGRQKLLVRGKCVVE